MSQGVIKIKPMGNTQMTATAPGGWGGGGGEQMIRYTPLVRSNRSNAFNHMYLRSQLTKSVIMKSMKRL